MIFTDRVRSTTVRYCFHRCLSVQRGERGYPKVPTPQPRYLPTSQVLMGKGYPKVPTPPSEGTYPLPKVPTPLPRDRTADRVLDTPRSVCLLRSCRRTFLLLFFFYYFAHYLLLLACWFWTMGWRKRELSNKRLLILWIWYKVFPFHPRTPKILKRMWRVYSITSGPLRVQGIRAIASVCTNRDMGYKSNFKI